MNVAQAVLSSSVGTRSSSTRAGYLPICLERAPKEAFENIPVYLRATSKTNGVAHAEGGDASSFHLYCADHVIFTEQHRERLVKHGVKFVYIPIALHQKFREQTDARLLAAVEDPAVADSVKSRMVYDTSVELMNELLSEPDLDSLSPRLETMSRSVTMLVLNDPGSFSHLMAASSHDFYTATHMVNVGTWMVPLAFSMGHENAAELNHICEAGLLHDVGKTFVPTEVLNKVGKLLDEDWDWLKKHPGLGCEHLAKFPQMHPLISIVTRQHHERMDGTGYPDRITGDQIHPISKICAVIDSFDAMTAFRPFKKKTMTVVEALNILKAEAPQKYDPDVVAMWTELLKKTHPQREELGLAAVETSRTTTVTMPAAPAIAEKRQFPRFKVKCSGRVHSLLKQDDVINEGLGVAVVPLNVSRGGASFTSQTAIQPGDFVRIYFSGKGLPKKVKDGRIVRCRDSGNGWFELGMKFEVPDETELPPEYVAR